MTFLSCFLRPLFFITSPSFLTHSYLWKYFDAATATHAHLMSLILMVNEKFREDVPVWTTFQSRPDAFAAFLLAVFRLPRAALTTSERVAYLVFLTHVYQVSANIDGKIMMTNHSCSLNSKQKCGSSISVVSLCFLRGQRVEIKFFSSTRIHIHLVLCATLLSTHTCLPLPTPPSPPRPPQSLEQPVLRKTALSMVSLSLWTNISAGRLAEQLRETPEYAPHMGAAAERKTGMRCIHIVLILHFPRMVIDLFLVSQKK